jgi:glycerol transport system ATP-binding protein
MWQGRVTQHGPTGEVYRRPRTIEAAAVFSDPPLNQLALEKRGPLVTMPNARHIPALGVLANLPDGPYVIGFRCDAASLEGGPGMVGFPGTIAVSEISGSENFAHIDVGMGTWVCLVPGLEELAQGSAVEVHVDMQRAFVFGPGGELAAAPVMAESA